MEHGEGCTAQPAGAKNWVFIKFGERRREAGRGKYEFHSCPRNHLSVYLSAKETTIHICRSFAPPSAHLVRNLYFDYSDSVAVASTSFLNTASAKVHPYNSLSLHCNISGMAISVQVAMFQLPLAARSLMHTAFLILKPVIMHCGRVSFHLMHKSDKRERDISNLETRACSITNAKNHA